MDTKDWFVKVFINNEKPEKLEEIWEPIIWGMRNIDIIPKIMGKVECNEGEQKEIKSFLYREERYELLIAMVYAEKYEKYQETEKVGNVIDGFNGEICDNNEVLQNLSQWQLCSFLQWCDEKDFKYIFEEQSAIEIYRLCYIALMIGYQNLALLLIGIMNEQGVKEGAVILEKYGAKKRLLLKKWVYDFCRKQTKGKSKNKLIKKMVRHGYVLSQIK